MPRKIFINLPVKDLTRSIDFYTKLGFKFDPKYTDEKATCMIIANDIFVMLLVEEFFGNFTKKEISDAKKSTEVLVCISAESKKEVDEMVNKAVEAGGRIPREPQDHGFMYGQSFEDLDGHIWEVMYMEENK